MSVRHLFDGASYEAAHDRKRLLTQLERVRYEMLRGQWVTVAHLMAKAGGTAASVTARIRDLRKAKHGALFIARRRVSGGTFEYRWIPAPFVQDEAPELLPRRTHAETVAQLTAALKAANAALTAAGIPLPGVES